MKAGGYRCVLIVCAEVLSKRIDGPYDGRNISILLGDGAGAVVAGPSEDGPGVLSTILHGDGTSAKSLYTAAPGTALGRTEWITKEDIDAGRVHFRMDGKKVFENGVARMSEAVFESLKANNLSLDEIDVLVTHQANLRMLEAIVERVGIPQDKVYVNVEEYGDIASASLHIAPDEARQSGMIQPGNLVQLVAFGSDFVWASALLRLGAPVVVNSAISTDSAIHVGNLCWSGLLPPSPRCRNAKGQREFVCLTLFPSSAWRS